MKERCAACLGEMFYQTRQRYNEVGNYCKGCMDIVNKNIREKHLTKDIPERWGPLTTPLMVN